MIVLLCLTAGMLWAEEVKDDKEVKEVKETLIYLEHSETLNFDEERHKDAQLLKGNVIFRHDDALMYCDSAWFYEKSNSLDAFGHVRLVQGDTLQGFSDVLFYDGNTKMARMRRHVKLIHTGTTLTTDSLNYDRQADLAWYYTGGTVADSLNTLDSQWGQYTPATKQAVFKTSVKLVNPNFVLTADTLKYNTESHIADLVGPTEIVYEEETTIYSTLGWYNTQTEESMLLERSQVVHTDGKQMTGDTIFYDKQRGVGDIRKNMEMTDSVQHVTLYGHFGLFYEQERRGYATDSALLVDWSGEEKMYIHADTLYTEETAYRLPIVTEHDSVLVDSVMTAPAPDTVWQDTSYRQVKAWYGVRIYRKDMQAVCDSMRYDGRDSLLSLYKEPVLWSDQQQMSADSVTVFIREGVVEHLHGTGRAIAIQQDDDPKHFNQLSGKEILAFLQEGELREIHVNGNAETVFYPHEDENSPDVVGVNKTQSSYVKLYIRNQKIDHILFTAATTGTMYPLDKISEQETRLGAFFWAEEQRPTDERDVFRDVKKADRPADVALSARDDSEPEETAEPKGKDGKRRKTNNKK
ncbi:MAG: hypothetical protein IJ169_08285 [Paludibacteraceae bacterium]|nr:hypothetical protein [Paludibacteraceae bacterium]